MEERRTGLLSVVVPAYEEEDALPEAAREIARVLDGASIPFELLFIDDGSRDGTWKQIQTAAASDSRIRGIRFSRNFGKEAAIFAGLAHAAGDCAAVLDCDLQHPPEKLAEMYALWQDGVQVVEGVKADRGKENPLHGFAAKGFYAAISRAAGVDLSRASDFKLLDRRAVDVLTAMREKNAFFRALSGWIGFRTAQVEYSVQPRRAGGSKWSVPALFRYALRNIASFTAAPLHLVTALGVVTFAFSVVLGIQSLWKKLTGQALEGFTTVILLQLLIGSALMISLGIIGYYLAKIYEELQDRPRYIVAEACGAAPGGERERSETNPAKSPEDRKEKRDRNGGPAYHEEPPEEIIGGKAVTMRSQSMNHNLVRGNLYVLFRTFLQGKTCVPISGRADLYLADDECYIPDFMVVCDPEKLKADGVHGAPDLVAEVLSPSTMRYDRGHKKDAYEKHGVRELWLVSPAERSVEQYVLEDGRYVLRGAYAVYPEFMLKRMKEKELAELVTEFPCAIFEDLTVKLEDVFDQVIPGV